jgi:hypothetical protein
MGVRIRFINHFPNEFSLNCPVATVARMWGVSIRFPGGSLALASVTKPPTFLP